MTAASSLVTAQSLQLIDTIASPQRLREAWARVRAAAGAPGIDGISIDVFKRNLDGRLDRLHSDLKAGRYAPNPLRRVRLPKPTGGWRLLGIPTVTDRIVQTACAFVLQEQLSPTFSARSFAYRPFLGPRRAAAYLASQLPAARYAITADIEKFFDNVEHEVVARQLAQAGVDSNGVDLVRKWLRVPVVDGATRLHPLKGIPQGAPVSPVIANMYLTGFDRAIEGSSHVHVRYADDFIVLAGSDTDAVATLQLLEKYLREELRLGLKEQKTRYIPVHHGFAFVGFWFTASSWVIPAESLARFTEELGAILSDERREMVFDVARRHNDLVRGWRNYYGGNSPEMDEQLEHLEVRRQAACADYVQRVGLAPTVAQQSFDTLAATLQNPTPKGRYPDDLATDTAMVPPWTPDDPWLAGDAAAVADRRDSHSTAQQLRSLDVARGQAPVVLAGRLLRIPTYGAFVTERQSLVTVRRKKQVVFECPLADVSHISIESQGVCISTRIFEACARRRVSLTVAKPSGLPIVRINPASSELQPGLSERQVAIRLAPGGTAIARALVTGKISNQRALLLYHAKYRWRDRSLRSVLRRTANQLSLLLLDLQQVEGLLAETRRTLFLVEARAAAAYWAALGRALPPELQFDRRRGRGAEDVVNKLLNFGYWSLYSRVWSALEHAGLNAYIGLLHTSRRKTPGLAFDAMEEFRQPLVDRAVLSLIGRGTRLELNRVGELTSRTRTRAQRAFGRALDRSSRDGVPMLRAIHRQAAALARAIGQGVPYQPYRSPW
jgi:group II intron reverse transcriptase/maturase/CRISPR-associated endonuclease Cas1